MKVKVDFYWDTFRSTVITIPDSIEDKDKRTFFARDYITNAMLKLGVKPQKYYKYYDEERVTIISGEILPKGKIPVNCLC